MIGNTLDISFSKVTYVDIAPRVGLEPVRRGGDILSFEMFHARLPSDIFYKIIEDVEIFSAQYGDMDHHENEEGRARYLSAVCRPSFLESFTTVWEIHC